MKLAEYRSSQMNWWNTFWAQHYGFQTFGVIWEKKIIFSNNFPDSELIKYKYFLREKPTPFQAIPHSNQDQNKYY